MVRRYTGGMSLIVWRLGLHPKTGPPVPISFACEIDQRLLQPRLIRDTYATVHHLTEVLYFGGDDVAVFEKPL